MATIAGALGRPLWVLALLGPVSAVAEEPDPPRLLGVQYLGDLPTLVADERGYFRGSAADLHVDYT